MTTTMLFMTREEAEKTKGKNRSKIARDAIEWYIARRPKIRFTPKFERVRDENVIKAHVYLTKKHEDFVRELAENVDTARHTIATEIVRYYIGRFGS